MRITIDLDSWWFQDLQRIINKAFDIVTSKRILGFPDELKRSPRGNGYHLIWYNAVSSIDEAIEIRKTLEDDNLRVKLDYESNSKPKQVLFTKRRYKIIKMKMF